MTSNEYEESVSRRFDSMRKHAKIGDSTKTWNADSYAKDTSKAKKLADKRGSRPLYFINKGDTDGTKRD